MSETENPIARWDRADDGEIILTHVLVTEAHAVRKANTVVFRIETIADEAHFDAIKAGTMKPTVLQLRLGPDAARQFASQLEAAADMVQRPLRAN